MDSSLLRAFPIGLLLFLGTYLALRRRKSDRVKAQQELPQFATLHGLSHQRRREGEIGVLTGNYEGFAVRVDPDEGAKIWLRFTHHPTIELRSFRFLKRAPPGMEQMVTAYRKFDGYFVERYVSQQLHDAVSSLGDLDAMAVDLKNSPQRIQTLSVSPEGIECKLVTDRVSYISRETLEHLLPLFAEWAHAIDRGPIDEAPIDEGTGQPPDT